ncbi:1-aminocyclopropane-1-carboxylate deaminase/D-cysteine desulfhydrase [uncultured Shewanella sp.]|uniref:1-aminocyclopropane-1-carboxylate deaminase/D-cysteine desulfhydrase n=1 Tax=uncultured Shewanella sp. TaxID=173975 RepID=UPI00261BB64E|nr:1-aminocyclopropane-1-carboxylate deaminase/D-cysteine desulfhydrase [uncultured Shewanella sp.]
MKLADTPVERIDFFGHDVFVKRDDLLHPEFSGNKARKFRYFLDHDFPDVKRLISFGSPQSNSMYSMSVLAKIKGWQFDYYVDHIAKHTLDTAEGNFKQARLNGANMIDLSAAADRLGRSCETYIEDLCLQNDKATLFIPEGGHCGFAQYGVSLLAEEIVVWMKAQQLEQLVVFLPSGTGTTSLYLSAFFKANLYPIEVMTCAAVGDSDYLKQQFLALVSDPACFPTVLESDKKYHFGKLYTAFYEMWQHLNETGIEFDLLYDPLGWIVLQSFLTRNDARPVLYLHQGGLLGNASMLPRYQRKFNLSLK